MDVALDVFTVTVSAFPLFVAVTALPTKSIERTFLLSSLPSSEAVSAIPVPSPPPPDKDERSTEFPSDILNAFVELSKVSVCESEPVPSVAFSKSVSRVDTDDEILGNVTSLNLLFATIEFF